MVVTKARRFCYEVITEQLHIAYCVVRVSFICTNLTLVHDVWEENLPHEHWVQESLSDRGLREPGLWALGTPF